MALSEALNDARLGETALAQAEQVLVTASDAAIEQRNGGDLTGSASAFRTTVTAAADQYDTALAAAHADRDAVAAAVAALDQARQGKP
jgi:hypothetical protein